MQTSSGQSVEPCLMQSNSQKAPRLTPKQSNNAEIDGGFNISSYNKMSSNLKSLSGPDTSKSHERRNKSSAGDEENLSFDEEQYSSPARFNSSHSKSSSRDSDYQNHILSPSIIPSSSCDRRNVSTLSEFSEEHSDGLEVLVDFEVVYNNVRTKLNQTSQWAKSLKRELTVKSEANKRQNLKFERFKKDFKALEDTLEQYERNLQDNEANAQKMITEKELQQQRIAAMQLKIQEEKVKQKDLAENFDKQIIIGAENLSKVHGELRQLQDLLEAEVEKKEILKKEKSVLVRNAEDAQKRLNGLQEDLISTSAKQEEALQELRCKLEEKERVNSNLAQKTSRQQQEISELQRSYSKLENAFSIQKTRSHEQVETISSAKFQLSETKKECASLNEQLQMHIAESSQLQSGLAKRDEEIAFLKQAIQKTRHGLHSVIKQQNDYFKTESSQAILDTDSADQGSAILYANKGNETSLCMNHLVCQILNAVQQYYTLTKKQKTELRKELEEERKASRQASMGVKKWEDDANLLLQSVESIVGHLDEKAQNLSETDIPIQKTSLRSLLGRNISPRIVEKLKALKKAHANEVRSLQVSATTIESKWETATRRHEEVSKELRTANDSLKRDMENAEVKIEKFRVIHENLKKKNEAVLVREKALEVKLEELNEKLQKADEFIDYATNAQFHKLKEHEIKVKELEREKELLSSQIVQLQRKIVAFDDHVDTELARSPSKQKPRPAKLSPRLPLHIAGSSTLAKRKTEEDKDYIERKVVQAVSQVKMTSKAEAVDGRKSRPLSRSSKKRKNKSVIGKGINLKKPQVSASRKIHKTSSNEISGSRDQDHDDGDDWFLSD